MRRLAVGLICNLVILPASAAPSLVGIWFGQGQPGDKQSMYLDHFLGNGELHSQFRDCRNGKPYDSTEDGTWSVKGDILTVNVARHDGMPAPRTDVYRLTSVTAKRFRDVYLPLNFPFDERRVDEKFVMPDCQLVS
ncbi:MAG TPA: hypothetical protein VJP60_00795 [Rhizomicrobium sp.]|nr:hypothetical protein [Rhizomicrobium sp.]